MAGRVSLPLHYVVEGELALASPVEPTESGTRRRRPAGHSLPNELRVIYDRVCSRCGIQLRAGAVAPYAQ